jgi:CheY-like chemotaxis protein
MARILVIDDELDIVRVVVKILSARGHDGDGDGIPDASA